MKQLGRFGRHTAALAAASALLIGAGGLAAFADDIYNDLDASIDAAAEVMSLNAGGANGTTTLAVQPRNGDGKNGCNLTGSTTLVVSVSSSDTAVATVSPSTLTFSSCDDTPVLTVTPVAVGTATISLSQTTNNTGGTFDLAPATFTVAVAPAAPTDNTPPVITPTVTGTLGNNGWYTSNVDVSWTVVDNESAVTNSTGCATTTIDTDTSGTTLTCSATSAGGTSSESVTIKRDATAPDVSLVDGPVDGGKYYFGDVPAAPTCTAQDATSGLVENAGQKCSVSGYETTVGTHTVKASAEDNAGNTAEASATYTVLAWDLTGFYRPVDMDGVWNTVKGGSTVPLKFNVYSATELTDTAVVKSFRSVEVPCDASLPADEVEFTTTGGTSLRYDATGGQFVQNWKTPSAKGCYKVTMTTLDDSSLVALFKTR